MVLILLSASYTFVQAETQWLKTLDACMEQGGTVFAKVHSQPFLPDADGFG